MQPQPKSEYENLAELVSSDPQWVKEITEGRACVCTNPQHGGKIWQCGSINCEIRKVLQSD